MIAWNNQKLEPVLITYNRAHLLEKTLEVFFAAGLQEMRLHVLDNASTDDTALVVEKMQKRWSNLTYHKNKYNIGGNANILRSVELTNSEYHWIIGDDDQWMLTPNLVNELMSVMTVSESNLIRLGWLASEASRQKNISARDLTLSENLFFGSVSMISSTIFKRDIFSRFLPQAYQNISDSYPQLVPFILGLEANILNVYTLSSDLLIHTPSQEPGYFSGDFEWYSGWFRTARFFEDPIFKKHFIDELTFYKCRENPGKFNEFLWLIKVLFYYKSFGLNQTAYLFSMFGYGLGWRLRISILILLNAIVPNIFLSVLRKIYFKLKGIAPKKINVDRSRL